MKEIVIISGKGGTGKTSIAASFAALAKGEVVIADCDVDAADMHLVTAPVVQKCTPFISGHKAVIRNADCTNCGVCMAVCRYDAIHLSKKDGAITSTMSIDTYSCEGCGVCFNICPSNAIDFPDEKCGEWYVSDTRFGKMVHAKLGIAAENSGRLVTLIRKEARKIAVRELVRYLIVDGSPGVGCPVIASLTGADLALIITEPTVSGKHDLHRILSLTKRLEIPAMVCINKWNINPETSQDIELYLKQDGIGFAGCVCYDTMVTTAQRQMKAVVEIGTEGCADDIKKVWSNVLLYEEKSISQTNN